MASGFVRLYSPFLKRNANLLPLLALALLLSASYLAGVLLHSRGQAPNAAASSSLACANNRTSNPARDDDGVILDFAAHHSASAHLPAAAARFPVCPARHAEHTPCEDPQRSLAFPRERLVYRERHCPPPGERLRCLVPAPRGYRRPFPWPESRGAAWFANVPHKELTVEKAVQNWVRVEGERFLFPGGGTMFPHGADAYIQHIEEMIPLRNGSVRTALDTGCGVASWGAYLLSRDIVAMSFAPRDTHEAQVQFALERGVPAVIGIMASMRLPYPSRAFDMAHCSRCLIPWHQFGGLYLMEVDRVLRPGGYWLLSGPPINWQTHWHGWERTREDLDAEQKAIEAVATGLCWKKLKQDGDIAIWQKPINHLDCKARFCTSSDPDSAWYTKMETCVTPLPEVGEATQVAGGKLEKWPARLTAVPPRILRRSVEGITEEAFSRDAELWGRRVMHYKQVHGDLQQKGRYRNILDMNAGLGGFAAALVEDPVWVMNVVPTAAAGDTLGVIYERGLIGTYHDWCEAMSTYPRTYDLIHSNSVFSIHKGRCAMVDILLEMDRILRPEGAVIFRDDVDLLVKVKSVVAGMRWDANFADHEEGPHKREKILVAVKKYWTIGD